METDVQHPANMIQHTWPDTRFRTIIADPAWKPSEKRPTGRGCRDHRGPEAIYDCMDLAEIKALPVPSIADPTGCHLYLWTTGTFLREAHEVAAAWGFDVRDVLTWIKPRIGLGYHWRRTTEFVIFGTMGKERTKRRNCRTHYFWPVGEHSEKSEEFFRLVESQSPGPYVELFALRCRPDWQSWGKLTEGSRAKFRAKSSRRLSI